MRGDRPCGNVAVKSAGSQRDSLADALLSVSSMNASAIAGAGPTPGR